MNERRKLHPVYVLFGLLNTIQGFLPLILIAFFRGTNWTKLDWYWYAGAGVLVAGALILSFLDWKRFGFWLEEDRIIIRRGVLFRDEKTIYYSRIHSVNVEQPLIQRLLRVAQVKIETPGGNKKADGILPALSLKEADAIQLMLRRQAGAKAQASDQPSAGRQEGAKLDAAKLQPQTKEQTISSTDAETAESGTFFRLHSARLMQAAATSMNFGLVAAFIGGLYSFADDFIDMLLPDHFFENVVEDSVSLLPSYIIVVVIIMLGLGFAWFLSIALYVLKYSGFSVKKEGKQISVSYGLLEKKTFVFDPKNVQAVIIKEGLLRQAIGYAEIQLQVISSDNKEQLMLHPFIKRTEVSKVLAGFVPQLKLPENNDLTGAPKRALLYYVRIVLLLTLIGCVTLIVILKTAGLSSLILIPLALWWRKSCHKAAGVRLADGQLTLRRRFISRSTFLIRRPQIVTMRVNRSTGQERRKLLTLSVQAMGSPFSYRVACMDRADVEPVWEWYSRSGLRSE
ncbi:PH domain-containing protein [Paenibacillus sp. sgz302251]|uniref:PH domain-containing protein n=1 Tax=Paenibacillus sp. sgz302251 TaxID=3414493 RepID=UPI003C7C36A6